MKRFILFLAILLGILVSVNGEAQTPKPVRTLNIVDALREGIIKVEAEGAGLSAVRIKVTRLTEEKVKIVVPAGTFFVNRGGTVQDMVATETAHLDLTKQKEITYSVSAACANVFKPVPGASDKFDIEASPKSEELRKLMEVIDKKRPGERVTQVAVWIITDDISRGDLDRRYTVRPVFAPLIDGSPAASDEDVIKAMQIVEEAGIDITVKKIFKKVSLIRGLRSPHREIQAYSLKKLEVKTTPVEYLISALKDNDSAVREAASEILGKIKHPRAVEPLIEALKDKDRAVRMAASVALGEIKDPRAVEPLISALKDNDWFVRMAASKALGEIKDPRAVEPLIEALKDKDEVVRKAAEARVEIKDPLAVEHLISALKDKYSYVRRAASEALKKITGKDFGEDTEKWQSWWMKNRPKK